MSIFNNTDHPIVVRMGEREFLIEANRFSQETIEEGEYALTVYKQKDNGKIRKVRGKADDEWGVWGYKWCPSLALSGKLIAGRDIKLHIGQTYQRFGFRMESIKGELELLECTVENGELQDAESFFHKSYFYRRMMRYYYLVMGMLCFLHPILFLCLFAQPSEWLLILVFQVLFFVFEWDTIRILRILRKYPVREIEKQ